MNARLPLVPAALAALALGLAPARAVAAALAAVEPPLSAAGVDEHLGAQLPLELSFTSAEGAPVRLGDAFQDGRPVVLVLAYYRCAMLCPLVLRGTAALVRQAAPRPGADYRLLTVSIDPRDRPADAAHVRGEMLAASGAGAGAWAFWTGGEREVAALADRLGFRYRYDARSDQYAHPAALFVLTPGGRVSRYLYGVEVPRAHFEAALAAAARGEAGSSFERVLLRCYHYVPALRRYGGLVVALFRGGSVVLVLSTAGTLFLLGRRARRREA